MAKQTIQGVSISLNLQTSEFKSKLEEITRNSDKASKELKELAKALKVDNSNIKLIDAYSEKLKEMKTYSEQAKDKMKTLWNEGFEKGDIASQNMVNLNKNIKVMQERIDSATGSTKELSEATEEVSESTNGWVDIFKGNILTDVVEKGLNVVTDILKTQYNIAKELASTYVDFLKEGVEYNAQMQTYTVSLTAMLSGDSEAATKLIADMKTLASYSGISSDTLIDANRSLIATGESAEKSEKIITALGNAIVYAGGGNDELSRMATNLQQIANSGKASALDIRQFAYAGVDIWGIMADSTGKTREQLAQMQTDGEITYEIITNALMKASEEGNLYYGAMERNASTYNGQIGAITTNFEELRATMSEGLFKDLNDTFLPQLNESIIEIKEAFELGPEEFRKSIKENISKLADNIMEWLPDLIDDFTTLFNAIVDGIAANKEMLKPHIFTLVQSIKSFSSIFTDAFWDIGYMAADAFMDGFFGELEIDTSNLYGQGSMYRGGGINSGDLGFHSGGLTVNSNITVNNNGQPIDTATIRSWGSEITDVVTQELARRV